MKSTRLTTLILATAGCVFLAAPGLGATLVITSSGYWQLTVDSEGIPRLAPFDDVIRMGEPDDPVDPIDPEDPVTLTGKVKMWATEVNEPQVAEAQGFVVDVIAKQGENGVFRTKSEMTDFTKTSIPKTLDSAGTSKKEQWQSVWDDKIWKEVRRIEGAGQMNTLADQVRVWEEIAAGFKASANAQWTVVFRRGSDGKTYMAIAGEASPFLTVLLQLILELLIEWLKTRGNLET